jgi:hypothetical protein
MPAKKIQSGTIKSINKNAKTMNVKSDSTEIDLSIDADTTITVNGYYRAFSDLAAGQKVKKIYYTDAEKGGEKLAIIIHVIDEKLLKIQKKEKEPAKKEMKPVV